MGKLNDSNLTFFLLIILVQHTMECTIMKGVCQRYQSLSCFVNINNKKIAKIETLVQTAKKLIKKQLHIKNNYSKRNLKYAFCG